MSFYAPTINTSLYTYVRPIFITEPGVCDRENAQVYIQLNESNFNFTLLKSDDKDIRFAEELNGSKALCQWVNYYDLSAKKLFIWVKLPFLAKSEKKAIYMFWGRPDDVGVDDLDSLEFYFVDDLRSGFLNTNKWNHSGVTHFSPNGLEIAYYVPNLITKTKPLKSLVEWEIEFATFWDIHRWGDFSFTVQINGDENPFNTRYYSNGDITSNSQLGSYKTYSDLSGKQHLYSRHIISYYEPTDRVRYAVYRDDGFTNFTTIERQKEGDTRLNDFGFMGHSYHGSYFVYLSWVLARKFYSKEVEIDLSNLYIPDEYVEYPPIDFSAYGPDITDVVFYHTVTPNGEPYKLSDNITGSSNSYLEITGSSTAEIIIDFSKNKDDLVKNSIAVYPYKYNSSSGLLYLEESDESKIYDAAGKRYWEAEDESGWIALEFSLPGEAFNVFSFEGEGVDYMPKEFSFQGGFTSPLRADENSWMTLVSGTCAFTDSLQTFYFENYNKYPYYRLLVHNTFGGKVFRVRRWHMYSVSDFFKKRVVSKLSLLPSLYSGNEAYFPKQISFYGSNDGISWTSLFEDYNTATPYFDSHYFGRWQEIPFTNTTPFRLYKLSLKDNWKGSNDKFIIDEWKMQEITYEEHTHYVLEGTSNNINNIWANLNSTTTSGWVYIVNDRLNYIFNSKVVKSSILSPLHSVDDLQQIGGN